MSEGVTIAMVLGFTSAVIGYVVTRAVLAAQAARHRHEEAARLGRQEHEVELKRMEHEVELKELEHEIAKATERALAREERMRRPPAARDGGR